MQLSEKQIIDFENLYLRKFGIQLERAKALKEAQKLLSLMAIVYSPNKRIESDTTKNINNALD